VVFAHKQRDREGDNPRPWGRWTFRLRRQLAHDVVLAELSGHGQWPANGVRLGTAPLPVLRILWTDLRSVVSDSSAEALPCKLAIEL